MPFHSLWRARISVATLAAAAVAWFSLWPGRLAAGPEIMPPGCLTGPRGICPLKHTGVKARISGPLARVTVTQEFENPFQETIEAVYTFPLPPDSAVDDMTMLVGNRTIRGTIKTRAEARRSYDEALRSGRVAGLLNQERPNIFTQSVANITPGAKVQIEISYVETMPYDAGSYEFNFPMVVGPRYIPGWPTGKQGGGWAPDTTQVPDASRVTPPVTPEGTRAGHDISVEVAIDAGVPIASVASKTHDVTIERPSPRQAVVRLRDWDTIPNKDFILRYAVAGRQLADAVLTHRSRGDGYFTLLLQPPERVAAGDLTPKELVFVLDTSGSMSGFPIEKAKEAMRAALGHLDPRDTFNLIAFSGDTRILFPNPVPATAANLRYAEEFLASRSGSGGTEMMKAIRAALEPSGDEGHVRVVCFMTDGLVGNDYEIIGEVQKHPESRVFAFGIGSSTNHFLLDNIAKYGGGEVEYVGLQDDGSAAARRFEERVRSPLLTDISIDWGGLPVTDLFPARVPDVFAAKPVVISGRYRAAASAVIRVRGRMGGRDVTREIRVNLPASQPENDVLATLWARRKIEDLTSADFQGLQRGVMRDDLKQQITKLGIDFRLMTPFTSFVAVEEKVVTEGGVSRRVEVPVDMPEGVSYTGVFGASGIGGGSGGASTRSVPGVYFGSAYLTGGNAPVLTEQVTVTAQAGPVQAPNTNATAKRAPAITALIARVRSGARPSVDESPFVFDGEAYVRVTLANASVDAMERLRKAGFTITRQERNEVTGHIAVEKLEAITQLDFVVWIAPR